MDCSAFIGHRTATRSRPSPEHFGAPIDTRHGKHQKKKQQVAAAPSLPYIEPCHVAQSTSIDHLGNRVGDSSRKGGHTRSKTRQGGGQRHHARERGRPMTVGRGPRGGLGRPCGGFVRGTEPCTRSATCLGLGRR